MWVTARTDQARYRPIIIQNRANIHVEFRNDDTQDCSLTRTIIILRVTNHNSKQTDI